MIREGAKAWLEIDCIGRVIIPAIVSDDGIISEEFGDG